MKPTRASSDPVRISNADKYRLHQAKLLLIRFGFVEQPDGSFTYASKPRRAKANKLARRLDRMAQAADGGATNG